MSEFVRGCRVLYRNLNPSEQAVVRSPLMAATQPREQGDGAAVSTASFEPGMATTNSEANAAALTEDEGMAAGRDGQTEGRGWGQGVWPSSVRLEVDVVQVLLTLASLVSRTWHLGLPRAAVFDELHFAKFVSLYMKRTFFFDMNPPLGKMLLALAGSYAGFEDGAQPERIGAEFPAGVPVWALRGVPAVMGSLVVPVVYQVAMELHLSRPAAFLAAACVLLDNAFLVQSRFMLMEGMLIFFSSLAIMSYLKFRNLSHSVKYSGAFTALLILVLAAKDFWSLLDDTRLSEMHLLKQLVAQVFALVCVPLAIYLSVFYVHLAILTKAGPHDNVMTSAFQASLEGGLAALTKGQPLQVAYGSQVTLRHTANVVGGPCWLHSHAHVYPMRYPDARGSSHQQQVTCYSFKDVNNWWIVKHPDRNNLIVDEKPVPVRHGDIIQLVHGITSRALNSHDVAAPVTPSNQEVSCYIDYNVSMPAQNLWRVEIVNRQGEADTWQTIQSHVRFVHVNTTTAIRITGKRLPEWGFHQLEVAADRQVNQKDTVWNVEEHRYTKNKGKEGEGTAEVRDADLLPLEPTRFSFWAKLWELQQKMFQSRQDAELEHKFSSTPVEWPFMVRNIAYWMSASSNAQIHLIGNLVVWASATLAVIGYALLMVFYYLRRQRAVIDTTHGEWRRLVFAGQLLVGGYLLHLLPYLAAERTLFLHHYLPAVTFKVLTLATLADHLAHTRCKYIPLAAMVSYGTVVLLAGAVYTFLEFMPVCLGNVNLSAEQVKKLTWRESWEFLLHSR